MANLLVTGGAGFIGSNFVHYWLRHHQRDYITNLDALTYAGHLENLLDIEDNSHYQFVHGNINDANLLASLMRYHDTVVNFAAETHVDRSLAGPEAEKLFYETNVLGALALLHAAKEAGVARFHQVSTDEVYGDLPLDQPSLKFHENFPYHPHSPYAISKATADWAVRGFARSFGLPITISNCTNNYGPYQTPEKLIPRAIALINSNQKIKLYTDGAGVPGKNVRDWLHVEDHCAAIEAILLRGKVGETYCIGGESELSNYQLVEKMLALMSEIIDRPMSTESHVELVTDRPGHDGRYAMNIDKIRRELGWQPKHTFESGFRSTVAWYLGKEGHHWLEGVAANTVEVREGQDFPQRKK